MTPLQWILLMTGINGLLAFAGALTFLISKKHLHKILLVMVAFSIGTLLGGAFFHLIPEALGVMSIGLMVLLLIVGFALFYFIEKVLHWHHCHKDGHCDRHPFTYLTLYGDAIHNFMDGLIIAAAFIISTPVGITTSLLILLHELPQEIGDFGILVYGGFTKSRALFYNFLSQLTAVVGGVLGFYFLQLQDKAIFILPIAAGGFIYLAVMDLIPEVFKQKSWKNVIVNLMALILGLLLLISSRFLGG